MLNIIVVFAAPQPLSQVKGSHDSLVTGGQGILLPYISCILHPPPRSKPLEEELGLLVSRVEVYSGNLLDLCGC